MVEYFENLIKSFNESQKCGFCWNFYYTGRKDYTNLITPENCECANLIFETIKEVSNYSNLGESKTITIDGFIGFRSDLSEDFYNEKGEGGKANSRYEKYLKPLKGCLSDFFQENICVGIESFDLVQFSTDIKLNYLDANLDGFQLRIIYRS